MELPSLYRQMSIGDTKFAERLAEGQKAAAEGDVQHPAGGDEDEPEWLSGANPASLQPAPASTQMDDTFSEASNDDDRQLELLNEKYADLNSKTYRMKDLMTKKAGILNKAGSDPYTLMEGMHDTIDGMEDGEDKTNDTAMYNAIYTIYESARKNKDLRDFCADLFSAQRDYYKDKEQSAAIDSELKMITKLYDEQEERVMMENLAKKREQRKAALETKASEKAKKLDAAAAAKAESSSAKKQRK